MRYSFLAAALFAATTLAAPIDNRNVHYNVKVVTCTDVVTVYGAKPTPAAKAAPVYVEAPHYAAAPKPTPAAVYNAPVATPAPAAAPASYSDGSPMSGGKSILSVINKYRSHYSDLKPLIWSDEQAAGAQSTTDANQGETEHHSLKLTHQDGAQCLTPGFEQATSSMALDGLTPFEMAYLSWMCENPGHNDFDPQLAAANNGLDVCKKIVSGPGSVMDMSLTEMGHHDILVSKTYTHIGCAFTHSKAAHPLPQWAGIWGCNLY